MSKTRRGERLEILPAVCQGGVTVLGLELRDPTGLLADWKSEEEMEERCTVAKRASPPRRSLG